MDTHFFIKTWGDPSEGFSWTEAEKKMKEVKEKYRPYETGSIWKSPVAMVDPSRLNGGFLVAISTKR